MRIKCLNVSVNDDCSFSLYSMMLHRKLHLLAIFVLAKGCSGLFPPFFFRFVCVVVGIYFVICSLFELKIKLSFIMIHSFLTCMNPNDARVHMESIANDVRRRG